MNNILEGKVALVTGGSRGIGAAVSKALASQGVHVAINYNSCCEAAEKVKEEIYQLGGQAVTICGNVSKYTEAKNLVEETISTFGRMDILINNAGITRDKTLKKLSEQEWKEVIEVNLNSVFNCCSTSLPHLLKNNWGRIVNISSIIGQSGGFGQTNYSAAKAGMIGFTKSLALELAKSNITVNAVCPGFIDTDMLGDVKEEIRDQIREKIPVRRFGIPEEVAKAVLFLVKDGDYITGQSINVNGGLYM